MKKIILIIVLVITGCYRSTPENLQDCGKACSSIPNNYSAYVEGQGNKTWSCRCFQKEKEKTGYEQK